MCHQHKPKCCSLSGLQDWELPHQHICLLAAPGLSLLPAEPIIMDLSLHMSPSLLFHCVTHAHNTHTHIHFSVVPFSSLSFFCKGFSTETQFHCYFISSFLLTPASLVIILCLLQTMPAHSLFFPLHSL